MIEFNRKEDKIGIIAPSSINAAAEELLESAVVKLAEQGFQCKYKEDIFKRNGLEFFASSRSVRLEHLRDAILDPEIKIIWAFRGGYGSAEIIFDCLDIKPVCPKIVVGISDITPILLLFTQQYKMPAIHGPVITGLVEKFDVLPEILAVLSGETTIFPVLPFRHRYTPHSTDNIQGQITGGNLTLFCNMIGTKLHPETDNKILLLEDVNEKGYKVHRNLMHLKNAGLLEKIKAIIFADFTLGDEHVTSAIEGFCLDHIPNIPVFKIENIGHGKVNYPIIFGANCIIDSKQLKINSNFKLT